METSAQPYISSWVSEGKMQQQTIAKPLRIEGNGLHTGKRATLSIYPAEPNSGVNFLRVDVNPPIFLKASIENVYSAQRCVTLGKDGVTISTVEHLLAALWGMGIDNALIEIEGEEVPALDGSAALFVALLKEGGTVRQKERRKVSNLQESVWVRREEAHTVALPAPMLQITYLVDYNHSYASEQIASFPITEEIFEREIAPARTFGFDYEVETLLKNGYALGGSLENAILITKDGPATPLRFENELVRHKILDLIGDLSLLGFYPSCHIIAIKASHNLHLELVKQLAYAMNDKRWIALC